MMEKDDLPESWARTTLGEICTDLQYGYTASASEKLCGPRFLRITDIQNGQVQWGTVPYCAIDRNSFLERAFSRGESMRAKRRAEK